WEGYRWVGDGGGTPPKPPRRCRRGGGSDLRLLARVPDQRVDVRIGLARGPAEVRIERLRSELGSGDRQRHVLLPRHLAQAQPAGTDLDALGEDAEVGLVVGGLVGDGHDGDVGPDGEGPELALVVAVVVLGDGSDGSHVLTPLLSGGDPFPRRHAPPRGSRPPVAPKRACSLGPERSGGPARRAGCLGRTAAAPWRISRRGWAS